MVQQEIISQVNEQVNKWIKSKKSLGVDVTITDGARGTLCHIIESIRNDPSPIWKLDGVGLSVDGVQKTFLDVLPNMLNELLFLRLPYYDRQWRMPRLLSLQKKSVTISTWEILHQISNILDYWCFIPKKEM